jgi:hypothetical protein
MTPLACVLLLGVPLMNCTTETRSESDHERAEAGARFECGEMREWLMEVDWRLDATATQKSSQTSRSSGRAAFRRKGSIIKVKLNKRGVEETIHAARKGRGARQGKRMKNTKDTRVPVA